MQHTVTVSTKTINAIQARLNELTREVKVIKARLLEEEPPYGSEEWWKWSDKNALEDIKAGRVSGPFNNARDLIKALHKEAKTE